ncbi:uncharacterized protein LOC115949590 [Quercus lobata]|uniref:Uncharacterized protein n=1 Tax=Quercus lobata TaxID=97700 RepID=A0A7N2LY07_QUELO|nr:uncharacterized protein LOC115949590 [Quercus lobata]
MEKALVNHNCKWGQRQLFSLPLWNPLTVAVKLKPGRQKQKPIGLVAQRNASVSVSVSVAGNGSNSTLRRPPDFNLPNWNSFPSTLTLTLTTQPLPVQQQLLLKPSPLLALFSLLFVLSMALGSILSLAILSIPIMNAFTRLAASMDKLSKVVSEEVPGTLSSLKLSGLEINELTQQLDKLRQIVSGTRYRKKERNK